jgi:hypothetical protein
MPEVTDRPIYRPIVQDQIDQAVEAALTDYKRRVRRLAIETAAEESWCVGGMNRRFKELGLEPFFPEGSFSATATITATFETPHGLTAATIRPALFGIMTNDSDVIPLDEDPQVVEIPTKSAIGLCVTARVIDTAYEDTAREWVESSLMIHLRDSRLPLITGRAVTDIEIAPLTDPDADAYEEA